MNFKVFVSFFLLLSVLITSFLKAQPFKKDTVHAGIYITSIHDIDFKQKEYTIDFWVWLKYKNKDIDFSQNLEIPQAKSVLRSFLTIDSSDNRIFMLMKLQCVMQDQWKIGDFPFDKQKLRFSLENSQYDLRYLIFAVDSSGKRYDPKFTLNGWNIDSCIIVERKKSYETSFGDTSLLKPHTEYSSFRAILSIHRDAAGLFWKMFIGMYIAFFIAYVCFYIHSDSIDSRFALSVGALFAVIGNKYIIDSSLPESTSFTLVDSLHGITLFFIFVVISATAFSLRLVKKGKVKEATKFDMIMAQIIFLSYAALNIYFISTANS